MEIYSLYDRLNIILIRSDEVWALATETGAGFYKWWHFVSLLILHHRNV